MSIIAVFPDKGEETTAPSDAGQPSGGLTCGHGPARGLARGPVVTVTLAQGGGPPFPLTFREQFDNHHVSMN